MAEAGVKPESRGSVSQAPAFLDPLPFLSFPSHIISIILVKSGVGGGAGLAPLQPGLGKSITPLTYILK